MTELDNSRTDNAPDAPLSRKPYRYSCRSIPWTDERITRLKELWARGELSAAQIANQLGVTRNSVLGKADRLNLPSHSHMNGAPRKHAPAEKRVRRHQVPPPPPPIVEPPPPVPFLAITFAQLTERRCHYPRGDDPILFCGQPTN